MIRSKLVLSAIPHSDLHVPILAAVNCHAHISVCLTTCHHQERCVFPVSSQVVAFQHALDHLRIHV
jgi:hypothetical protein